MVKSLPFYDGQYVYTTRCGLSKTTNYCSVPENTRKRATFSEIKKALDIFKKYNLQIKILGGNPSDEPDFPKFIDYMNTIDLDYAVTDNAVNYFQLAECDVKGVIFSMDTLGKSNMGGCSYTKSILAKNVIPWIRSRVNYLGANIIINKSNLNEIEDIVKFLTENKAIANLCPLITGKPESYGFKYAFRVDNSIYSLNGIKKDKITNLCKKLIEMKKSGYLIGCPEEYLEMLPNAILKLKFGWNCGHIDSIPILKVNNDLSLMVCSDVEGNEISKYSIFDLDDIERYSEIQNAWITDEHRMKCCEHLGCYWSNIVIADIYREKGYGTLTATRRNL